mmetsp:Transcript_20266/g.42199  ORF Transcript_20266/g.42199 Transcript_20266/m.42199 type:complete len:177 (-) Transcript_20266:392-922(-)
MMTPNNSAVTALTWSSPPSHPCGFSCPGWIMKRTSLSLFSPCVTKQHQRQNPFSNHSVNLRRMKSKDFLFVANDDAADHDKEDKVAYNDTTIPQKKYEYKPPQHSESFLRHLAQVKSSWPGDCDDINNFDEEGVDSSGINDKTIGKISGGVYCTGEPAMDPSRLVQTIFDGESDWV